jgi:hypothetical protein
MSPGAVCEPPGLSRRCGEVIPPGQARGLASAAANRIVPVPFPPPEPACGRGWWRYAAALLLGGYLLFAHGCHGDEDTELFARALQSGGSVRAP